MDDKYVTLTYEQFMQGCAPGADVPADWDNMRKAARKLCRGLGVLVTRKGTVKEDKVYNILCPSFELVLANSNYLVKNVSAWHELETGCDVSPDLTLYPRMWPQARTAYKHKMEKNGRRFIARAAFAWMALPIEVKYEDPPGFIFDCDDPEQLLRDGPEASAARAQQAKLVAEILLRQHRTHVFSIYTYRQYARLFRWDRDGVIVSDPIDMVRQPEKLLNFVYRIGRYTGREMGLDTSTTVASPQEIEMLQSYVARNAVEQGLVSEVLKNQPFYPILKVPCRLTPAEWNDREYSPISPGSEMRHFLIGKHVAGNHSPMGRGTKGFVALELPTRTGENPKLWFMKDCWRPLHSRTHTELETYQRLRDAGVEFVPHAIAGGDVADDQGALQTTKNLTLLGQMYGWVIDPSDELAHFRLVTSEIGRPLASYPSSDVLVYALLQAYSAHRQAWEEARILHCDISPGNILISIHSDDGKVSAFLNDWDLCKWAEDMGRPDTRSGTWPYMSAHLLRYPKKPNDVADDIESFVYVFLEHILRFHVHSRSIIGYIGDTIDPLELEHLNDKNERLRNFCFSFFFQELRLEGRYVGGGGSKYERIQYGCTAFRIRDDRLQGLLEDMYSLLKRHYDAVASSGQLEQYFVPRELFRKRTPAAAKDSEPALRLRPRDAVPRLAPQYVKPSSGFRRKEARQPPSQAPSASPLPQERVLDSHQEMHAALVKYVGALVPASDGSTRLEVEMRPFCSPDKTPDQFYGFLR